MLVFEELGDVSGYEAITPSTSIGVTGSLLLPTSGVYVGMQARAILVTVETAAINFTLDGTAPTASAGTNAGHRLQDGESLVVKGSVNIKAFRCIDRVAASPSLIKITVYH